MNNTSNPSFDDAIKYVNEVKDAFRDEKHIYRAFLRLLEDFKSQRKNMEIVKEEIAEMFKDRKDLILGFNFFLPAGHENILALPSHDEQQGDDKSASKDD
jgi:histone deacetylase complex regulatory component SIN3